jgi:hypothetical protein
MNLGNVGCHSTALSRYLPEHMTLQCMKLVNLSRGLSSDLWYHVVSNWTPYPQSASEQYRPNDRRLSAKLLPTFSEIGCRVISTTDPYGHVLGFLDQSPYFFFQVAPQLMTTSGFRLPKILVCNKNEATIVGSCTFITRYVLKEATLLLLLLLLLFKYRVLQKGSYNFGSFFRFIEKTYTVFELS